MERFVARYHPLVTSILSGFDRLVFRGTLIPLIRERGMRFNAGHALNYFNVEPVAALPGIRELHIGHAIVSRAVFVGMRDAVKEMKALMMAAR